MTRTPDPTGRERRTYYNELDEKAAEWLRALVNAGLIASGDVDERSIEHVKPEDLVGRTRCHFFAGIGGWDYALRLAGWPADRPVWTGSCPCQPFSCAGKGKAEADDRHLWPQWFRIIKECRPPIIFGEQVASASVVGYTEDEDLFEVWTPQAIRRISEWLKGEKVQSMQTVCQGNDEGVPKNEASAGASQQAMAFPQSWIPTHGVSAGKSENQRDSLRDNLSGNTGESGRGGLRGDGNPVQSVGTEGMELPIIGSDSSGGRLYVRQYASRDLRLQRDGERMGGSPDSASCGSNFGAEEAELQRLVDAIGREIEEHDRLEWVTRVRTDLEGIGYSFGASVLCAAGASAPHLRQRLFWVAHLSGARLSRERSGAELREQRLWERGSESGRCDYRRFGDTAQRGFGTNGSPQRSGRHVDEPSEVGGVGNDSAMRRTRENGTCIEEQGPGAGCDATDRLVNMPSGGTEPVQQPGCLPGFESASPEVDRLGSRDSDGRRGDESERGSEGRATVRRPMPWDHFAVAYCRDNKFRRIPVEPAFFPLVDGAAARVVRLRGYGNAIVPAVAASFIQAFLETEEGIV